MMYQTPQGLVYAAPAGIGALPEGFVLNLPQAQTLAVQGNQAAGMYKLGWRSHKYLN